MRNFLLTLVTFPFLTIFTACGALLGSEVSNEDPCVAPDSTYAYSIQQEWENLTYDLVFCWTAEEVKTEDGQTALLLEKGDGSAWVKIALMSGIPTKEIGEPLIEALDEGITSYTYEGYFTITTNSSEDSNVKDIIRSFETSAKKSVIGITVEWKGITWYPIGDISPCIDGSNLLFYPTEELEMTPGDSECNAPYRPAGDAPLPIVASSRSDSLQSLEEMNESLDEQFKDDPYYESTWGEIETRTNANGVSYRVQNYIFSGDAIPGVPTGLYVWVDLANGEHILFDLYDPYEDLLEPLVDQIPSQ